MIHKTGLSSFYTLLIPYMLMMIAFFFLFLFYDRWLLLIPGGLVYLAAIVLRWHMVRKYNIIENGFIYESIIAIFCCPCSITQMARHIYGYQKVFDGDADPDTPHYDPYRV